MAEYELAIKARRAVTPDGVRPVTVAVRAGKIAAVAALVDSPDAARVEELPAREILLPGLVNTHVHVNEPGRTEWEGFASATRAAAEGGVTTLMDMPLNCLPPTTTTGALRRKQAAARGGWVDVGFWGGAVPRNLAELAGLRHAGVFGFKAFLVDSGCRSSAAWIPPVSTPSSPRWRGWTRCLSCTPRTLASSRRPPARPGAGTRASWPRGRRPPGRTSPTLVHPHRDMGELPGTRGQLLDNYRIHLLIWSDDVAKTRPGPAG